MSAWSRQTRPAQAARQDRPVRIAGAAAWIVLIALLALLAGCVRIPTDGEVSTAEVDAAAGNDELLVLPEGPAPGASPREILLGFIRAGRGPQDGYSVAAEYLTDEFAASWWPNAGVLVTSSTISPVEEPDGTMSLSIDVAAELDSQGRYTSSPAQREQRLVYELAQEDGEWRISSGPDGTVLSPSSFDAIFEPARLHYFSPDYRFPVPELRWFPDTRTIANRVVDELLAGDSPELDAGVLRTAFPAGTTRPESVDINGGSASVTLSSQVLAVDDTTQSRMLEQLDLSLGSLGTPLRVTVVAGGFPVSIPELADVDRPQPDSGPVGMLDGAFGTLGPSGVLPIAGIGSALDGLGAQAVSLGRDRSTAAVLTDQGVQLVTPESAELLDARVGLSAPSLDPWGWVWSVPREDPSGLLALAAGGEERTLPITEEGRVLRLQVSRDGTRLLVALDSDNGTRVVVWGIVRDDGLAPVELVSPVVVSAGAQLVDVAWTDGVTIATLGRGASAPVTLIEIGGRSTPSGSVPGGVQLAAGTSPESVRVRDSAGAVWRRDGDLGWVDTGWRASFLGVQQ